MGRGAAERSAVRQRGVRRGIQRRVAGWVGASEGRAGRRGIRLSREDGRGGAGCAGTGEERWDVTGRERRRRDGAEMGAGW